jgi:hypothetical protein
VVVVPANAGLATALRDCGFVLEARLRGALQIMSSSISAASVADMDGAEAPVEDEVGFGLLRSDAVLSMVRAKRNREPVAQIERISSTGSRGSGGGGGSAGTTSRGNNSSGSNNNRRNSCPAQVESAAAADDSAAAVEWWRGSVGRNLLPADAAVAALVDNLDRVHGIMYLDRVVQGALMLWMIQQSRPQTSGSCPPQDDHEEAPTLEARRVFALCRHAARWMERLRVGFRGRAPVRQGDLRRCNELRLCGGLPQPCLCGSRHRTPLSLAVFVDVSVVTNRRLSLWLSLLRWWRRRRWRGGGAAARCAAVGDAIYDCQELMSMYGKICSNSHVFSQQVEARDTLFFYADQSEGPLGAELLNQGG